MALGWAAACVQRRRCSDYYNQRPWLSCLGLRGNPYRFHWNGKQNGLGSGCCVFQLSSLYKTFLNSQCGFMFYAVPDYTYLARVFGFTYDIWPECSSCLDFVRHMAVCHASFRAPPQKTVLKQTKIFPYCAISDQPLPSRCQGIGLDSLIGWRRPQNLVLHVCCAHIYIAI